MALGRILEWALKVLLLLQFLDAQVPLLLLYLL